MSGRILEQEPILSEERIQADLFKKVWNDLPQTRRLFFHVSNELPNDNIWVITMLHKFLGKIGLKFSLDSAIKYIKSLQKERVAQFLAKRRAIGVVSGEPDMILIWAGKAYGFELKTDTGTVSESQVACHQAWQSQLTPVFVIRSVEEGYNKIFDIVCKNM